MYAAKNIIQVIDLYEFNNILLGGLIVNKRDNQASNKFVKDFANKINTDILTIIPRSKLIFEAEKENKTVVELNKDSGESKLFIELSEKILKISNSKKPKHINSEEFNQIFIKS